MIQAHTLIQVICVYIDLIHLFIKKTLDKKNIKKKKFQQQLTAPQKSTETSIVDDVKHVPAPDMIFCDPNPFDPDRVSY